jgi:hypothetical protein
MTTAARSDPPSASSTPPSRWIERTAVPKRQRAPACSALATSAASNAARSSMCPEKFSVTSGAPPSMKVVIARIGWRAESDKARASTLISAGTNSAHCTGLPGSRLRSTAMTSHPRRAASAAAQAPAGPRPTTTIEHCSRTVTPPPLRDDGA